MSTPMRPVTGLVALATVIGAAHLGDVEQDHEPGRAPGPQCRVLMLVAVGLWRRHALYPRPNARWRPERN